MTGGDAQVFTAYVLSVLRQASGEELVFGRPAELSDEQIGRLVRQYAEQRGLVSQVPA